MLLAAGAAGAQSGPSAWTDLAAHRGRLLRVTVAGEAAGAVVQGWLREVAEEGLRLEVRRRPVEVRRDRVERVELLPRPRLRGMILGALLWGGAAWAFSGGDNEPEVGRAGQAGIGMLAGAALGALHDFSRQPSPRLLYERAAPQD